MRFAPTVLLVAALVISFATTAVAQSCLGLPTAPTNLSFGVGFPDGGKSYSARFGVSQERFLGGASVEHISADDIDVSATGITIDAGMPLGAIVEGSSLQVCPVASANVTFGPDMELFGVDVETRSQMYSVGMAAGGTLDVSPGLSVVPNASLALLHIRSKATATLGSDSESASDSETGGMLYVGIAFVFNEVFAAGPGVAVPLGFDAADSMLQIRLSMGFGGRR